MHILSVQSNVSYGYVGNRVASFVFHRLGFHCTAIDTAQFSNHTGYPIFKGRRPEPEEIRDIYEAIVGNGMDDFDACIIGNLFLQFLIRC